MDKHKIIMPDVEGFARPETRRGFLKALAAAGMGAAAGSVLLGGTAEAQTYGASQDAAAAPAPAGGGGDLEIANFARSRWSTWSPRSTPPRTPPRLTPTSFRATPLRSSTRSRRTRRHTWTPLSA